MVSQEVSRAVRTPRIRVDNDRGRTLRFLLFLDKLFFHSVVEHAAMANHAWHEKQLGCADTNVLDGEKIVGYMNSEYAF